MRLLIALSLIVICGCQANETTSAIKVAPAKPEVGKPAGKMKAGESGWISDEHIFVFQDGECAVGRVDLYYAAQSSSHPLQLVCNRSGFHKINDPSTDGDWEVRVPKGTNVKTLRWDVMGSKEPPVYYIDPMYCLPVRIANFPSLGIQAPDVIAHQATGSRQEEMEYERDTYGRIVPKGDIDSLTIRNMKVGDNGWTVPWAMSIDAKHHYWLDSVYTVEYQKPGGTVCLRVEKEADGYYVVYDPNAGNEDNYRWDVVGIDTERYVPVKSFEALPLNVGR